MEIQLDHRIRSRASSCVTIIVVAVALGTPGSLIAFESALVQPHPDSLVLVEQGPAEQSILHADGSVVDVQTKTVWRYMCGSNAANTSIEEFRAHVDQVKTIYAEDRNTWPLHDNARGVGGLNIVWNISGSLPAGAEDALNIAAAYIETQFGDPISVPISVSMFNFGNPNVIGSTGSSFASPPSWSVARNGLINDMDGDDTIQDFLPSGSTIPVRYNASSATITNENRVFFTRANYNAAIGTTGGSAASMQFNTGFSFDYDPSNGITGGQMCFQSVVVHEVGHALGFTSAADGGGGDIEGLDIFRFQFTDGAGDYNPDTEAEFQTTARTVDFNNLNDDVISDLISAEYRMSDGSPNQASHFRTTVPAIMDPNLALGETFYPNFFRIPDINMFDAIGWDFPLLPPPLPATGVDAVQKNRYLSFIPNNDGEDVAYQIELTVGPGSRGIIGWAGEPDANGRSLVVDTSYYSPTWPAVVQVADCEIVPVATYDLRLIVNGSDEGDPDSFSNPLTLSTIDQPGVKFWADSVGELIGSTWSAPNAIVNFNDVTAVILGFQVAPTAPPLSWVDLQPEVPNQIANFADVQSTILAFIGDPYPYSVPSACP